MPKGRWRPGRGVSSRSLLGFYLTCPNHSRVSCACRPQPAAPLFWLLSPRTLVLYLISLFFFRAVFNSSGKLSDSFQTNFRIQHFSTCCFYLLQATVLSGLQGRKPRPVSLILC